MKKATYSLFVLTLVMGVLIGANAQAAEKSIKFHIACWNVPSDPTSKVLNQIAADLQKASGGAVVSEISYQALGKPGDYYEALVGGMCDIAYFGPTYSPGRFLMSEALTLPIAYPNLTIFTKASYAMWKKGFFDKQFEAIKVFALGHTVDFLFMWAKKPVTGIADFKNRKMSSPSAIHAEMVEALGAVPVSLPATELYSALDTGVLDGAIQGWPFISVFKAQEVVKYATEPTRSAWPIVIAINKNSYEKLPKEAKAVLENNSEKYSHMQSEGFQNFGNIGKEAFLKAGGKIGTLPQADVAKMDELFKPIFKKWIDKTKARGLPAEEFLDGLYSTLKELGVNEPFAR